MSQQSKLGISFEKLDEHEVMLFPTSNIRGEQEAETRATSSLLSMVKAVSEFAGEFCSAAGGPGGRINNPQCYTEVSFVPKYKGGNTELSRPDGLIYIKRGKTEWAAFLEVKIGKNKIDPEQIQRYIAWAAELKVHAVISVSNESAKLNGAPPYELNKRNPKAVVVKHFSWERLHAIALKLSQSGETGVLDDDQRWMLSEWERYLASVDSQILVRPELGQSWFSLTDLAQANNLPNKTEAVRSTFENWLAFLRVVALRLGAKLKTEVVVKMSANQKDYEKWFTNEIKNIQKSNIFPGRLVLKRSSVNPIDIELHIDKKTVEFSYRSEPWHEGRQTTKVERVLKPVLQVSKNETDDIHVIVDWGKKQRPQATLLKLKETYDDIFKKDDNSRIDKKAEPKEIIFRWSKSLKGGRGKDTATFLQNIYKDLVTFYKIVEVIPSIPQPKPQLPTDQVDVDDESTAGGIA